MRWLSALAGVLLACGAPATTPEDASLVRTDAALLAPQAPIFTPCPPGWREVVAHGVTVCDAWPEGGRAACAPGEAHFPGEPGCARVGTACPADGWPADLPTDRPVVWVDARGPDGPGTSRDASIQSLFVAVQIAPPGAVIALRAGRYPEPYVSVAAGQTVWGACASGTSIARTSPGTVDLVHLDADRGELRNVTLEGTPEGTVSVAGDDVVIRDVIVVGGSNSGIYVSGVGVTLERVVVRDIDATREATGLFVSLGGSVTARRLALLDIDGTAALVGVRSTLALEDSVVDGVTATRSGSGSGIGVTSGSLSVARSVVTHAVTGGITTALALALDLVDVVVTEIGPIAHGGHGVYVEMDPLAPRARLARVHIEACDTAGLNVHAGGRAGIDASDLLVGDTHQGEDDEFGMGIWVGGAEMSLARVVVDSAFVVGMTSSDGARVTATDVVVRGVRTSACVGPECRVYRGGFGVSAHGSSSLTLTRFSLDQLEVCGVVISDQLGPSGMDLEEGVVDHAPVGACVQQAGFDVNRLNRRVVYRDVDVPLSATSYTLPDAPL